MSTKSDPRYVQFQMMHPTSIDLNRIWIDLKRTWVDSHMLSVRCLVAAWVESHMVQSPGQYGPNVHVPKVEYRVVHVHA